MFARDRMRRQLERLQQDIGTFSRDLLVIKGCLQAGRQDGLQPPFSPRMQTLLARRQTFGVHLLSRPIRVFLARCLDVLQPFRETLRHFSDIFLEIKVGFCIKPLAHFAPVFRRPKWVFVARHQEVLQPSFRQQVEAFLARCRPFGSHLFLPHKLVF